jgi:hypothetical protein
MPNILSIPRELRDDIYERLLGSPLQSNDGNTSRPSLSLRKRVWKGPTAEVTAGNSPTNTTAETTSEPTEDLTSKSEPTKDTPITSTEPDIEYYESEEVVRYPLTTPLPPLHSLLHTSRQLRAELQDTLSRKRLHYKIHLAYRDDTDILYPTWTSIPVLSHRVDTLEVDLRVRAGKSSSLVSANGDDERETTGDPFDGGMVLLRRFLERGVYFLSKKKARKISVGLMSLKILKKGLNVSWRGYDEILKDVWEKLDDWFSGEMDGDPDWESQDELMRFLAERIERFECWIEGVEGRKGWDLKDVVVERERRKEVRREEREQRGQDEQGEMGM